MAITGTEGLVLLVARVLFGGVIAFTGLNHFLDGEGMVGYAQHKGLRAPKLAVYGSGAVLVLGGIGIVLGVFPLLSAIAVAIFLISAAVSMHDFWSVPEDQQQNEMTQFLKNVALAGGALALAVLAQQNWAFSAGLDAL